MVEDGLAQLRHLAAVASEVVEEEKPFVKGGGETAKMAEAVPLGDEAFFPFSVEKEVMMVMTV